MNEGGGLSNNGHYIHMTRFGNEPLLRALTHTLGEGSTLYGSHPKRHLGGTQGGHLIIYVGDGHRSTNTLHDWHEQ